jgi:hypothetical protein
MTFVFYQWGNSQTVSQLMQWVLRTVETWCDKVGLSVNPDKTELVVFTRKRKLPGFFEPHFFGVTLCHSMSAKYLRVVLDSQLTWREHVDITVRKAHNLFLGLQEGLRCNVGPKTPKWSNGSTSLLFGHPSLLHP